MRVVIDREAQVQATDGFLPLEGVGKPTSLFLHGAVLGAFDGSRTYDAEAATGELRARAGQPEALKRFLRHTVGWFTLLIQEPHRLSLWNSPGSPGFMYVRRGEQLVLSDNEREAYSLARSNALNEMEMAQLIFHHIPSPYLTIFQGLERAPGGHVLDVLPDLMVRREMYLLRGSSEAPYGDKAPGVKSDAGERFRAALEAVARCVAGATEDRYLLFSGGLDSTVILLSLLKSGAPTEPVIALMEGPGLESATLDAVVRGELVGELLGIEPRILSIDPVAADTQESLTALRQRGLGFTDPHLETINVGIARHLQDSATGYSVLEGDTVDSGLGLPTKWRRRVNRSGPRDTARFLKAWAHDARLRYQITARYQRRITARSPLWVDLETAAPRPPEDLPLAQQAILTYAWHHPYVHDGEQFAPPRFPPDLSNYEADFLRYKVETVLRPCIGDEATARLRLGEFTADYLNHVGKCLKYIVYTSNQSRIRHLIWRDGPRHVILPGSTGPLLDFFYTHQLSLGEAVFPKKIIYDYFQREVGTNYPRHIDKNYAKRRRDWVEHLTKRSSRQVLPPFGRETWLQGRWYAEQVAPLLNPADSAILDRIQDDRLRLAVRQALEDAQAGTLSYIMRMMLWNVEVFLRGLSTAGLSQGSALTSRSAPDA